MPTIDAAEAASQLVEHYRQTNRGRYAIMQDTWGRFLRLCELADLMIVEQGGGEVHFSLDPSLSPNGTVLVETDDLIVQGGRNNPFFTILPSADIVQFSKSTSGMLLTRFAVRDLWVVGAYE